MFGSGFYNPYLYQPYYQAANVASNLGSATGTGILGKSGSLAGFKGLLSKFSFSGFLNSASKTLNVVNQLIPLYKEAKPMLSNAQNAFKIAKEFMTPDNNTVSAKPKSKTYSSPQTKNETSLPSSNRPVFFV